MEEATSYHVSVSPNAAEQIKKQLSERGTPEGYLRLGIKGGGCSGFSYVLQFEDGPPKERDLTFESEGVRLVIDKKSVVYLNGTTLEWEQSLLYRGFKFINPNEKSRCGCGQSFTV
jgi:iron-sulfur cluster assembly protein